jgi:predicted regulator of Ras-like GTPase activity (Roadblock/LC7/MglB family)
MFGFLKNLLRKPADAPAEQHDPHPAAEQAYDAPDAEVASVAPAHGARGRQNGRAGGMPQPQRGTAPAGNFAAQGQSASQTQGRSVQIPLQPILDGLPLEIQPRVVERNVGDLSISIPLEKVLSQLSRGAVRITFGELRQLAPDIFSADVDRDRVAVPLPLSEILSRLNPALIARRRVQKHIEVPAEISSPFDPSNQGLIFNIGPSKPESHKSAPATAAGRQVTPGAQQKPSAPSGLPSRGAITSAPTPQPPSINQAPSAPISFAPRPTGDLRAGTPGTAATPTPRAGTAVPRPAAGAPLTPSTPQRPQPTPPPGFDAIASPIRMTPKPATGQAATPAPTVTPAPRPAAPSQLGIPTPRPTPPGAHPTAAGAPASRSAVNPGQGFPGQNIPSPFSLAPQQPIAPAPTAPAMPGAPVAMPRPQPGHTPIGVPRPAPAPAHAAPSAPSLPTFAPIQPVATKASAEETLVVPLAALAEGWPEPIRKEAVQLGLVEAKVALPVDLIGQSLKMGRIAFPWQTIRSWAQGGGLPAPSPNDGIVVELPLKVIAPLFLARPKQGKDTPRVSVDAEIPNLFFGFPQGDNGANAVAKPADTNYYVWDDKEDTVHATADDGRKSSVETRFATKCATPNEVVSRAAALEGVAGALVALPDGLMVASRISPDLNSETLAAFLPQIFTKMTTCTKELRMGDLNNLHFTVGNTPWKIFKVNAIFFAAFGRPGEGLPTSQLSALAAELDHKPK